jgi:hypothetical protein
MFMYENDVSRLLTYEKMRLQFELPIDEGIYEKRVPNFECLEFKKMNGVFNGRFALV